MRPFGIPAMVEVPPGVASLRVGLPARARPSGHGVRLAAVTQPRFAALLFGGRFCLPFAPLR